MPSTITGTATYSNSATVPSDGDTATAASLSTPLQTVLNNTRYLQQSIESTGITKIRQAANSAALKALASIPDGDVVILDSTNRMYRRNTSGTGSDAYEFYYDHDTESGGWDLIRPPNSLFNWDSVVNVANASQATNVPIEIPGASCVLSGCKNGDIVQLTAMIQVTPNGDNVYIRAKVTDGAAVVNDLTTQVARVQGTTLQTVTYFAKHDLTADGSISAKLWFANGDNATNVTVGVKYFRMDVYRP